MKKNLILASAAFVFAAGSAVASMFVTPENVWVKAQFGNQQSDVICTDLKVQCDQSSNFPCKVVVQLAGTAGSVTVETNTALKTYRAGCLVQLGNVFAGAQASPLSGSDRPTRIISEP